MLLLLLASHVDADTVVALMLLMLLMLFHLVVAADAVVVVHACCWLDWLLLLACYVDASGNLKNAKLVLMTLTSTFMCNDQDLNGQYQNLLMLCVKYGQCIPQLTL